MRDTYARFLLSVKGKILVLLATAVLLAGGISGVLEVLHGITVAVVDIGPGDCAAYGEPTRPREVRVRELFTKRVKVFGEPLFFRRHARRAGDGRLRSARPCRRWALRPRM